jgi:hypothetical protein
MKAALSIVLAGLLITLPAEQVLAQAAQQEAVSVQQTEPSDPAARLFRVPPLTENSALLLGASSERAQLEPSLSNRYAVPGWSDWSNGKRALVVVGVIVAAYVVIAVIVLSTCGDSCR